MAQIPLSLRGSAYCTPQENAVLLNELPNELPNKWMFPRRKTGRFTPKMSHSLKALILRFSIRMKL